MSFVCLGLFTTEFVGQFAIEGLQPSRTPAFAEPNVFEAFGVVMFTYALGRVSDPCGRRTRAHRTNPGYFQNVRDSSSVLRFEPAPRGITFFAIVSACTFVSAFVFVLAVNYRPIQYDRPLGL